MQREYKENEAIFKPRKIILVRFGSGLYPFICSDVNHSVVQLAVVILESEAPALTSEQFCHKQCFAC